MFLSSFKLFFTSAQKAGFTDLYKASDKIGFMCFYLHIFR